MASRAVNRMRDRKARIHGETTNFDEDQDIYVGDAVSDFTSDKIVAPAVKAQDEKLKKTRPEHKSFLSKKAMIYGGIGLGVIALYFITRRK